MTHAWDPPATPLAATLIVLAGGRGRRMKQPKAQLSAGAGSLLGLVIARLGSTFSETIVGGLAGTAPPDVSARVILDRRSDAGPLAGIEAGLAAASYATAFVIACDMPRVTPELARLIVAACAGHDAAVIGLDGRSEPVCAAYRRSALPVLTRFLDGGGRRASELLGLLTTRSIGAPELATAHIDRCMLDNLNTIEEYERFLRSLDVTEDRQHE